MSSSETHAVVVASSRQSWPVAILCAVLLAPALAACGSQAGFRPLYGPTASGVGVQERMAQIKVAPIPSRVGQRIRNELIFQNTGGGRAPEPVYTLEIAIKESVTSALVQTTGESLSQVYAITASFRLIKNSDKQVVMRGESTARAGFERFQSIYSNVRAREDAENRVANTIAEEMKGRIAAFLAGSAA
jgi:LPS-assembly lipoprotein